MNLRNPFSRLAVAAALVGSLVVSTLPASAAGDPGVSDSEIVLAVGDFAPVIVTLREEEMERTWESPL